MNNTLMLQAVLTRLMREDYTGLTPDAYDRLKEWADKTSRDIGFDGWVDAYHRLLDNEEKSRLIDLKHCLFVIPESSKTPDSETLEKFGTMCNQALKSCIENGIIPTRFQFRIREGDVELYVQGLKEDTRREIKEQVVGLKDK